MSQPASQPAVNLLCELSVAVNLLCELSVVHSLYDTCDICYLLHVMCYIIPESKHRYLYLYYSHTIYSIPIPAYIYVDRRKREESTRTYIRCTKFVGIGAYVFCLDYTRMRFLFSSTREQVVDPYCYYYCASGVLSRDCGHT